MVEIQRKRCRFLYIDNAFSNHLHQCHRPHFGYCRDPEEDVKPPEASFVVGSLQPRHHLCLYHLLSRQGLFDNVSISRPTSYCLT